MSRVCMHYKTQGTLSVMDGKYNNKSQGLVSVHLWNPHVGLIRIYFQAIGDKQFMECAPFLTFDYKMWID